jgi:anhydro-N-acetylmuramic acid kinase
MEPMPGAPDLFIGLMSGTSLDGVDGVLVDGLDRPRAGALRVLASAHRPFEPDERAELLALNAAGPDELHRAALAGNRLARQYAAVCADLLAKAGVARERVRAIGAHGQTVRHRPGEFDGLGYTVQLDPGAVLADLAGIDVVSNFRVRDVAAGGQGAPLVPGFHAWWLSGRPATGWRVVLNLGGIANVTLVGPAGEVLGFDCGPGNVLLDLWAARHLGRPFDDAGAWAGRGRVQADGLRRLLETPFLRQAPPKSTGRDLFSAPWLEARLADPAWSPGGGPTSAADVQATLAEFTAACVEQALVHVPPGPGTVESVWVCGGGTRNADLMQRLARRLDPVPVQSTAALGLDPQWVEATAFAWLAACHLHDMPGSIPAVTGARKACVLGTRHCA